MTAEAIYYALNLHITGESITYEQYLKAKSLIDAGLRISDLKMEMIQ